MISDLPFCGPAPSISEIAWAWNVSPFLWGTLAIIGSILLYSHRRGAFGLGWLALVVAFVSPLCALTVGLFSARALHHLLLLGLAAPLLGAALPQLGRMRASALGLPIMVLVLMLWHVPDLYSRAWSNHTLYWLMQLGLIVPSLFFWSRIASGQEAPLPALGQIGAFAAIMGLLGAILVFAPQPLYLEHHASTALYGLTPLEDQQLAGLIMWVPGFVPLLCAGIFLLRRLWASNLSPSLSGEIVE